MFEFGKSEYTEANAYEHYNTDGHDPVLLMLDMRPRTVQELEEYKSIVNAKEKPIKNADDELLKTMLKQAGMMECKMGVCKALNGRIQEQYDYNYDMKNLMNRSTNDNVKCNLLYSWLITISFDATKLIDNNGKIRYTHLVKITKSIQISTGSIFDNRMANCDPHI